MTNPEDKAEDVEKKIKQQCFSKLYALYKKINMVEGDVEFLIKESMNDTIKVGASLERYPRGERSYQWWHLACCSVFSLVYAGSLAAGVRTIEFTLIPYPESEPGHRGWKDSLVEFRNIKDLALALNALTKNRAEKITIPGVRADRVHA